MSRGHPATRQRPQRLLERIHVWLAEHLVTPDPGVLLGVEQVDPARRALRAPGPLLRQYRIPAIVRDPPLRPTAFMRRVSAPSEPGPPEIPGAPRNDWQTIRSLLPYLADFRGRVALALTCLIGAKFANLGVRNLIAFGPHHPRQ